MVRRSLRALTAAAPLRSAAYGECPASRGARAWLPACEMFAAICLALVVIWSLS